MKHSRNVVLIIIVLGVLSTFGIMASTTSAIGSLSDLLITLGFYLWVAVPFIVLIALTIYIHRRGFQQLLALRFSSHQYWWSSHRCLFTGFQFSTPNHLRRRSYLSLSRFMLWQPLR